MMRSAPAMEWSCKLTPRLSEFEFPHWLSNYTSTRVHSRTIRTVSVILAWSLSTTFSISKRSSQCFGHQFDHDSASVAGDQRYGISYHVTVGVIKQGALGIRTQERSTHRKCQDVEKLGADQPRGGCPCVGLCCRQTVSRRGESRTVYRAVH